MTVVYFGPLTCSIITTTRKFFTILASVILFSNPISGLQWMGTIFVFLGKYQNPVNGLHDLDLSSDGSYQVFYNCAMFCAIDY